MTKKFRQTLSKDERSTLTRTLTALGDRCVVRDDGEVIGVAADGTHVSLGNATWGARSLLSYLTTCPTPSDW